jgi:pimeloyl-ACP methyl ester carboxylesterase
VLLLHGLFGALSNWEGVVNRFSQNYRVIIPMLPIYDMPIREAGLEGLRKFVEEFVAMKKLDNMMIMGNSLGGHIALVYTLKNPEQGKEANSYRKLRLIRGWYGRIVSEAGQL